MKILELIDTPSIILTNEEKDFVTRHKSEVPLRALYDRDEWLARNLVRKGVYEISNDNQRIVLRKDVKNGSLSIQKN